MQNICKCLESATSEQSKTARTKAQQHSSRDAATRAHHTRDDTIIKESRRLHVLIPRHCCPGQVRHAPPLQVGLQSSFWPGPFPLFCVVSHSSSPSSCQSHPKNVHRCIPCVQHSLPLFMCCAHVPIGRHSLVTETFDFTSESQNMFHASHQKKTTTRICHFLLHRGAVYCTLGQHNELENEHCIETDEVAFCLEHFPTSVDSRRRSFSESVLTVTRKKPPRLRRWLRRCRAQWTAMVVKSDFTSVSLNKFSRFGICLHTVAR